MAGGGGGLVRWDQGRGDPGGKRSGAEYIGGGEKAQGVRADTRSQSPCRSQISTSRWIPVKMHKPEFVVVVSLEDTVYCAERF